MLRKIGPMLLISAMACADAQATDAPIVFTKQTNNVDDIYLISSVGGLRQVTDNRRKDSSPRISPDGKHMVFTSERVGWWKIWLMDLQQNSCQQLTEAAHFLVAVFGVASKSTDGRGDDWLIVIRSPYYKE